MIERRGPLPSYRPNPGRYNEGLMSQTMTQTFLDTVEPLVRTIDDRLRAIVSQAGLAAPLADAADHAVLAGGKRLRPILTLLCCDAVGGERADALGPAAAIELIHAFSLVHDDLPALDNDLLRRGLPTVHAKFGEATAILTGDVLMSLAFEVAANGDCPPAVVRELAAATTAMINGQVFDTLGGFPASVSTDADKLEIIHRNKTGALLTAACRMGAICGGATPAQLAAITTYGHDIGLMFQIVDDLLDVTQTAEHIGKATGKDHEAGKVTFPGVLGIEESQRQVRELHRSALKAVEPLGEAAIPLRELSEFLARRTK